jgi:glycosyltransferase involved in cell wall biosynthesis
VLAALQHQRLSRANWYIHEDVDQLPALAPFLLEESHQKAIRDLVEKDRLRIYVPSKHVKSQYEELFSTEEIRTLPFTAMDEGELHLRDVEDYSSLRFLLSGRPTDGRKGHMVAVSAFHEFVRSYYEANPARYRDFSLTLVGMTNDYIAAQIVSIGKSILGDSFHVMGEISHSEALKVTRECNAVICCSFNEALPLYVIEAMSMGHIVIRNGSGGLEEQLKDGVNGFRIDGSDVRQFASMLERLLNRTSMTDRQLHAMGRTSQRMLTALSREHSDAIEDLQVATA